VSEIDRHEEAVKTAYEAGLSNGKKLGVQIGIEMGMKRATEIMSRDLHNFKFPEGQIPIDMPLEQHAPKDNSTFEFSNMTYGERILEREAAQRNVRRRRSNRMVAKNRKRRSASKPNGTWTAPVESSKIDEDHGYDELLAEEGIYVKA
jgi:hypothetical protein|tara:strand:- start:426 stop:869 length:444 start_codon:yes stop_codon:yes gene_type:complete